MPASHKIEKSIVQIYADHSYPSYAQPWSYLDYHKSTSTGFCVAVPEFVTDRWRTTENSNKYIITNAHCVHNSNFIKIRKRGESTQYRCRVDSIVYECDLAILSIDYDYYISSKQKHDVKELVNRFWDPLEPLTFGGLPNKLDRVYVYGYPLGGYNISITSGSVNRIQIIKYYEVVYGIAIQIDAPINFGNSGGPVVDTSGIVIGIAFSGEDDRFTQNMGYIIPTGLVEFFLRSIVASRRFRGLCSLEIGIQTLDNIAMREYLKVGSRTGILVNQVNKFGASAESLHRFDVIVQIDGKNIANDGSMLLADVLSGTSPESGEIVPFSTFISLRIPGDVVTLTIIRDGKEMLVKVVLGPKPFLIPIMEYQIVPSYCIVAGLVFVPLSLMVIDEKAKDKEYISHMMHYHISREMRKKDEQIIILSQRFDSEITEGIETENNILKSVNSTEIVNLDHLHRVIKTESKKSSALLFEFWDTGKIVIINSQDYIRNQRSILLKHIGDVPEYIGS